MISKFSAILTLAIFSLFISTAYAEEYQVTILSGMSALDCTECFEPSHLEIKSGDTITWINEDSVPHTITSGNDNVGPTGAFHSSILRPSASYSFTFEDMGTYEYYSVFHPKSSATITVDGDSTLDTADTVKRPLEIILNKKTYHTNDMLEITGIVENYDLIGKVLVKVHDPFGKTLVFTSVTPSANGSFFKAVGLEWTHAGTYKVQLNYEELQIVEFIEFSKPTKTNTDRYYSSFEEVDGYTVIYKSTNILVDHMTISGDSLLIKLKDIVRDGTVNFEFSYALSDHINPTFDTALISIDGNQVNFEETNVGFATKYSLDVPIGSEKIKITLTGSGAAHETGTLRIEEGINRDYALESELRDLKTQNEELVAANKDLLKQVKSLNDVVKAQINVIMDFMKELKK